MWMEVTWADSETHNLQLHNIIETVCLTVTLNYYDWWSKGLYYTGSEKKGTDLQTHKLYIINFD